MNKYFDNNDKIKLENNNQNIPSIDLISGYAFHPVTGCQFRDHTIDLIPSQNFKPNLNQNALFCCHNGPAACSCDIVMYRVLGMFSHT